MELNDHDLKILEAYQSGTLSGSDRAAFEQRMEASPEFKQAVRQILSLENTLEQIRAERLRVFLREKRATIERRKQIRRRMLGLAAILIIAVGVWGVFKVLSPSSIQNPAPGHTPVRDTATAETPLNRIATARFKHYPAPNNMSPEATKPQDSGIEAYKRKQYAVAIPLLEQEYRDSGDKQLLFFLGIACVGTGQGAKAVAALEACRKEQLVPQQENDWYLLLAYLRAGDKAQALAQARQIQLDTNHNYRAAAEEVEKEIAALGN
jgi:hypothetical protein